MPKVQAKRVQVIADALTAFEPNNFENSVMEVGIIDKDIAYPDGTKLVDVALWNEFGTDNIPARPAVRTAIINEQPKLRRKAVRLARDLLYRRKRFDATARILARDMVKAIKRSITAWDDPPNADATIAKKGFDNPLIETKLYVNSIDFKINKTRRDQV